MDNKNIKKIEVPLGGNSFIMNKYQSAEDNITPDGWKGWDNPDYIYSVFFKSAVDAKIKVYLLMNAAQSESTIEAAIGDCKNTVKIARGDEKVFLGEWDTKAGYIKVDVRGLERAGEVFAFPYSLEVEGLSDDEMASYARLSDKKDFYWIRRGPSVHCQYDLSEAGDDVEWFYNEVTINKGDDPHGTYGMAIGFHGGYFGMQVCDDGVRKVIFSIWAPYNTDHPEEIPEEKRIHVLGKHPKVYTGEFGGEGSGGQSFMDYEWESGKTYKFLVHVHPRDDGKTEFTSYFYFEEEGGWKLLCSFLRPETTTYLKGVYSFLESFIDVNGSTFRRVRFGNQWAVTKGGKWLQVNRMKLTGDVTARKAQRQDYGGGVDGNRFFLNNCGFFSRHVPLDSIFERATDGDEKPSIDLDALLKLK